MKDLDKAFLGHPKPIFSLSMTELWEIFILWNLSFACAFYVSCCI